MPRPVTGRYAQIRATLTGTGTATPSLSDIQLECNRASSVESKVIRYRFDEAGNILEVVTDTRYGRRSDKRDDPSWDPEERINNLNQIMRQDIDGDSWDFTWDANGNLTSKTNGSESFTYVWDEDNRLTQVSWDGAVGGYHAARFHSGKYHAATGTATQWTVDYTYDSAGRMLTRDDNNGNLTRFYWTGWQMVKEVTGASVTEYLIPQSKILCFKRDNITYHVTCDAMGSVRLVTNEAGEVISRFNFGAYGEVLAGSFDGVPGGMPYTWIGSYGIRLDSATGLIYIRRRWYSVLLQRFLPKDPIGINGSANPYAYCNQSPLNFVDVGGSHPVLIGLLISAAFEAYNEASGNNARAEEAALQPGRAANGHLIWISRGSTCDRSHIIANFIPQLPRRPGLRAEIEGAEVAMTEAGRFGALPPSTYAQVRNKCPEVQVASKGLIDAIRSTGVEVLENQLASEYNAITGKISLIKDPTVAETLEEFIHHLMYKAGIRPCTANYELVYQIEKMTKEFLMNNAKAFGFNADDLKFLELSRLIYMGRFARTWGAELRKYGSMR